MNIRIVLTSYLLTYMYGDLVFHNPLLLTREVIKKAYNEGLFYISSEKNINLMLENQEPKRTILAFSGIPTFEDVCLNLSPSKKIYALKMNLPYEVLASFSYQEKKEVLEKREISLKSIPLKKVILTLTYEEGTLCYKENVASPNLEGLDEDICKHLKKEIENYKYAIEKRMNYLRKLLFEFLDTESSKAALEDEKKLQEIKESYEELMS